MYEVGTVTWGTFLPSHTCHFPLAQNHVSFYPMMEERRPVTKGTYDPMDIGNTIPWNPSFS